MERTPILTLEEAADWLRTTKEAVLIELEANRIKNFRIGGQWRMTEEALMAFITGGGSAQSKTVIDISTSTVKKGLNMNTAIVEVKTIIPSLEDLSKVKWDIVDPFDFSWPDGKCEPQKIVHTAVCEAGGRRVPLVIGSTHRTAAGIIDRPRVTVFRGEFGGTLYPQVEWVGGNNFENTRLYASPIKHANHKTVRLGDTLPDGYESMQVQPYTDIVYGPNALHCLSVVAHEDDFAAMARHGLLRLHQRGYFG